MTPGYNYTCKMVGSAGRNNKFHVCVLVHNRLFSIAPVYRVPVAKTTYSKIQMDLDFLE